MNILGWSLSISRRTLSDPGALFLRCVVVRAVETAFWMETGTWKVEASSIGAWSGGGFRLSKKAVKASGLRY